ncbi:MAG: murein biosynthesis integral membrane protein MurJ [Patescibacteria group bacterium]|jgi:putative peptidoglycan lipid II flippase
MVNTALKKFGNGLFSVQNSILSAAAIIGVASGANAVLGLLKGRFLASMFGVSRELTIFYVADRIPNMIYSVLVVGAVSTVFIPIFSEKLRENKEGAWPLASSIFSVLVVFFGVLGGLLFIFSRQVISALSLGRLSASEVVLGANLMRIMIASQLILVISSFITSILQSFKYFLIPALSPILYNLGLLAGILLLSQRFGIYGPALGVVIGSALHLLIQLPLMKKLGVDIRFNLDMSGMGVQKVVSLVPFRVLSVVISNVISTINNSLAILVSVPSVVYLAYASTLQFFPVSLFAVSMSAALLPTLSVQSDDLEKFKKIFLTSLHQMLFLIVPASLILAILRVPVVRLVYGVSNFPWEATVKTSYTLAFFAISIYAQGAVYLITRAFYALKDTATPVKVSLVTFLLNACLSLSFIRVLGWGVWSLALSFSIMSTTDFLIMLYLLSRKLGGFSKETLIIPIVKIFYAAAIMSVFLYLPLKLLDNFVFDTTRTIDLILLTATTGTLGMSTYLLLTKLLKVEEIQLFYRLVRKLSFKKSTMQDQLGTDLQ